MTQRIIPCMHRSAACPVAGTLRPLSLEGGKAWVRQIAQGGGVR